MPPAFFLWKKAFRLFIVPLRLFRFFIQGDRLAANPVGAEDPVPGGGLIRVGDNQIDWEVNRKEDTMRLRFYGCLLAVGSFFMVQALAHVGLMPRRGVSGTHHVAFSVRAPVEKDIPTVELKIEIPSEW